MWKGGDMNKFIFDALCELKKNSNNQAIKSISIEVKYINNFSRFYFSILLSDDLTNEVEFDEVVIEIKSDNGSYFDIDLSDSSGFIYMEDKQINSEKKIMDFLEAAKNKFSNIFEKLLNSEKRSI